MSFTPRSYPDITRDLLTTLTGGTVRETAVASVDGEGRVEPILLQTRPVHRISHVEELRVNPDNTEETIRFTPVDYGLVASEGSAGELDTLQFRPGARQPAQGSRLTINYYPKVTEPVPLTDLNVGSVARTLMETFSRELAASELQMEHVYKSAFLESATGASLEKVVALIGMRRFPAGHAQVNLRFTRNPNTPGKITVPTATVVTDADGNRYKTTQELVLEPGENSRDVRAAGATPGTAEVAAESLNRLETLVAGIASVSNPKPSRNLASPETDEALRSRAKGALHGVSYGTLSALKFGILSIPGVNAVTLTEFPNDIPGEVLIDIAYGEDTPAVRDEVTEKIRLFKPAGIRVITAEAENIEVRVSIQLTLAGTGVAESEIPAVRTGVEEALRGYLENLEPGGKARRAQMISLVLADSRIVDCTVSLRPGEQPPVDELTLSTNQVLEVITPFDFPLIESEELPAPVARKVVVSAVVPYLPVAGVTEDEAQQALQLAFDQFINTRSDDQPVTVDALAAILRDESRYALVRPDIVVTVEVADTFLQLTDGLGRFAPDENDTLTRGEVHFDNREGSI